MSDAVVPTAQPVAHAVMLEVPAATVDCVAFTAAGFTTTTAVWVIATVPFTTALTVLDSASVDDRRPALNTPPTFVVPVVLTSALLPPLALHVTLAPLIGLLN